MPALPVKLELSADDALVIHWNDGTRRRYPFAELRSVCPCATCREKRNAPPASPLNLTILSPQEARPTTVTGMRPVGNYAYAIAFSDGHDTGIFTLEFLRQLGEALPSV